MIFEQDYESLEPQNSVPEPEIQYDGVGQSKTIKFSILVKFFNNLSALRGVKKGTLVKKFIQKIFQQNRSPSFTYSIIRLILPNDDRERGNYGLKQKGMAKIVADTLNLNREQYQRLYHYKNPNYHKGGVGIGDFSICMYDVVKAFCRSKSTLTVIELNDLLDQLASVSDQTIMFRKLFQVSNAQEIKWITRIILKDLKLGIKIETVLNTFHPDGNDFYNLTNSLLEMCRKFENPKVSLNDDVEIFHPIRPMLAGKKRIDFFKFQNRSWFVETKYDGERLQVHYDVSQPLKVRLFSRNGVDYNHIYEDFITYFQSSIQADSCILDGEMIVIDRDTHNMMHFGLNKAVALAKEADNLQLCYKVFDVLWVRLQNEQTNFMSIPLRQRKKILPRVIQQIEGRIQIVKYVERNEYEQILSDFNDSIERNEQGIMCKDPTSCYVPKQRGVSWLKLKGEYIEGLTDNFDLIILGGYFGTVSFKQGPLTHWTDNITHFLVGVIEKVDEQNPRKTTALALSRIGSGLNAQEMKQLRSRLKGHLVQYDKKKPPKFFQKPWKHDLQHQPACWIDSLQNSIILQVKASQIVQSNVFPTNMTLRFPRIVKIRDDKDWKQAMTKADLDQMNDDQFYTKGLKRRQPTEGGGGSDSDGGDNEGGKGRKRMKKFKSKKIEEKLKKGLKQDIMLEFKPTDVSGQKLKSHLFTGIQFNVLPPPSCSEIQQYETKPYIEKMILLHGGKLTQNPLSSTKYIVAREMDLRLEIYMKNEKKSYIYVKPIYIVSCVEAQQILPLSPLYLTVVPKDNLTYYQENFDHFGDSYTNYIDLRELQIILKGIPDHQTKTNSILCETKDMTEDYDEEYDIDWSLMEKLSLPEIRRGKKSICFGIDQLTKIKLRMHGNIIVPSFEQNPNSIICSTNATQQDFQAMEKYVQSYNGTDDLQVQFIHKLIETGIIT